MPPPSVPLPTPDEVRAVLATVVDPELGADIVTLGMVPGVVVGDDGVVTVTVKLTIGGCPMRADIKREIESRLARNLPPEEVWAEHLPLFQSGIPIIAGLVNLGALVKEQKIMFIGLPLALSFGDGSPVRAAALLY